MWQKVPKDKYSLDVDLCTVLGLLCVQLFSTGGQQPAEALKVDLETIEEFVEAFVNDGLFQHFCCEKHPKESNRSE